MRIIAGEFRGHPLVAPRGSSTRPTADRVREALFAILGDVTGTRVLDLYAGSGALGLEALSRGASHATFVESGHAARTALERNIAALGVAGRTRVVALDARRALGQLAGAELGIVFLDPPYASDEAGIVLAGLTASRALLGGAWVVLEHAARTGPPAAPDGLEPRFTRIYGDTALTFYRHPEAQ